MKRFVELGAVRIGAVIQNICADVNLEVVSLPGGSLIAVLLWLYAVAMRSTRHTTMQIRASRTGPKARSVASERLRPNGACVGCACF